MKRCQTRVLMLGMVCAESAHVLDALVAPESDLNVVALAVTGEAPVVPPPGALPRPIGRARIPLIPRQPSDPVARATERGIPVHWLGAEPRTGKARLSEIVADFQPDAVIVGCFPWLVPPAALATPRLGCLNVHPSLLPALRGPEPVFWAFRRGMAETGVSVHVMNASFDSGPILAQERVSLLPGSRLPAIEAHLMARGGRLAVRALRELETGKAEPVAQDPRAVSVAPFPTPEDWLVPTHQSARWAFTFAHAVSPLGGPLALSVSDGTRIPIVDAIAWRPDHRLYQPLIELDERHMRVQFQPGTVDVRVATSLR